MKNFIKTVFAVLFGNIIFFGIFFLMFLLMIIGISVQSEKKTNTIKSNSVLKLAINGPLSDITTSKSDFSFDNDAEVNYSIFDLTKAISNAKTDGDIDALWIAMDGNSDLSYAQIDLVRKALLDFKESKKPIIAYGEVVSQKMYYLSTLADKIYLNPNGGMDVRGFGAQLSFIKNTLDKLEIQPQIFYAGKFKSATEPLRLTKMSEENKVQTRALLQDISSSVVANIANDRKMSIEQVNTSINQMQSNMPHDAVASKMIDGERYIDQVEDELKKMTGVKSDKRLNAVNIKHYIEERNDNEETDGKIAVYVAEGDIIDGKSSDESIGSTTVVQDLRKIADDDDIKGVVLRINSPGGSALASAVMLREIQLLQKTKPVVVSMGNVAASGGYYIASSGEKIFAEPNTITGSIGVFGIIPNVSKMMEDKLGITFDEVELNDHAVMGVTKPLDPLESSKIQTEIENTYHTFKSVVSQGRKISIDSVEQIAQGRVWSGIRAKSLGLVDEIGDLKTAVNYLAKKLSVDNDNYFFYNKRKNKIEKFIEDFSGNAMISYLQNSFVNSILGDYAVYFKQIKSYHEVKGIQAKMPYQVDIR